MLFASLLQLLSSVKRVGRRRCIALVLGVATIVAGGCAADYTRRADISSVQAIGVVVPPGASEPGGAKDVMQLYNLTVGEDRVKNAAVGAGAGAAAGTAAGIGAGAIIGCTAGGPLAPLCWGVVLISGAVLGGGVGAIAGATVDSQEQVATAPVHLYEVNRVLPGLTQDYLASPVLQARALQFVREQATAVDFVPAVWNGERYAPVAAATPMAPTTDVNLVLTGMNVSLNGKAKDDPNLILSIVMHWALTKYDPDTQTDEVWDAMSAAYESKQHRLSEWLTDGGALLKGEVIRGSGKR